MSRTDTDPTMNDELSPQLERHLAELPRTLEPQRDLWVGIEARLEPRSGAAASEERAAGALSTPRPWGARQWVLQAVAALFFMAVGAWLTGGLDIDEDPDARLAAVAGQNMAGQNADGETVAFASTDGARSDLGDLDRLERDYRQARDALWLYLMEHQEALPSGVLKVVETNLRIIDDAGSQILDALAQDPGNPELQRRLVDNRRRSLGILRNLSRKV